VRRYHWTEISGVKDCLTCATLGESSILQRKLTLLQGNDAAVKFACPLCGFTAVGVVAVDGSEVSQDAPSGASGLSRRAPAPPVDFPDPLVTQEDETYVPPKTDAEAIERAYGKIVPPDEFIAIVEHGYVDKVESGNWKAERRISPTRIQMGDQEIVDVLVEFVHNGDVIYSCKHSSTSGIPDLEAEERAVRESCLLAIRGPVRGTAAPAPNRPRGPVAVISGGAGMPARVAHTPVNDEDAATRAALMSSFTGGA
jgi:hypothetical protein